MLKTAAWAFVSAHAEIFGIKRKGGMSEVSHSGYYRWIAGAKTHAERQAADDVLVAEIYEIHAEPVGTQGLRKFPGSPNWPGDGAGWGG